MKYLRPKRKGLKIKVSPTQEITISMFNVVRVEELFDKRGAISDSFVTIMASTGAEMKYQGEKAKMWTRKLYVRNLLENSNFYITDNHTFSPLK